MATYAINTSPDKQQKRVVPRKFDEKTFRNLAAYLATVNRSKGDWQYAFKILPRPKGRATRVLVTEYLDGVPMASDMRARDGGDRTVIAGLEARGFNPAVFARQIVNNFTADAF